MIIGDYDMKEYILTNSEARLVDQYAIDVLEIPGVELMEKAGSYVSSEAKKFLKEIPGSRVDLFCGTGNNGGDGFVAANDLYKWGANVFIWIVGDISIIKGDALYFFQKCKKNNIIINSLKVEKDLLSLKHISETDLIIDALLGTGFRGEVRGMVFDLIELINKAKRPVLSVDIPSGINGDTGQIGGVAVKSIKTITMGFLKRGLLFQPGKKYAGEVVLADLGYPEKSFSVLSSETVLIRESDVKKLFPSIPEDTYKHRQGKVLIFAGSPGMTGAASLASIGALRGGVGLVVTAIPESLNTIMEIKLTEALTLPLPESSSHTFCKESLEPARERIEWSDVVVYGPGVSNDAKVKDFGLVLVDVCDKPIIIDADGLRIFHNNLDTLKNIKDLVITPHLGELSEMMDININKIKENIIDVARDFVKQYPCTLVVKGAPTVIVGIDGTAAVNSTGNPALATGGTGDVLTGLIAAFRAQRMTSFEASVTAVFIHGYAGDIGYQELGIRGVIAGDLLNYIPIVLKKYDRID